MTRNPTFAAALLAAHLCVPVMAVAQTGVDTTQLSLEEASRLTWRTETRAQGIAGLRRLVSADPESADARFELGRVLTWDVGTRAEGIALLRDVAAAAPERLEVGEALAEVLAWDDRTRAEAIARLRGLVEQDPSGASAQVKLADVLSWNAATRDEARALYLRVLRDNERSVPAAVGLARLLSWSGQFSESRTFYKMALAQDPMDQSARVGIAELDGWTGRARASLKTLSEDGAGAIETPDAIRLQAQAYTQIGRPARALEQYNALLAMEPGDRTVLQASRLLRREMRPVLEIGTDGSGESGDPATSRVETSSLPLRFSFHPGNGDAEVSLNARMASYRNSVGSSRDTSVGAGVDMPVGNRVRLSGDLMGHTFERASGTFSGGGQLRLALNDAFEVRVGAAREQLSSSRLSLAGEESLGVFYGPSLVSQFSLGASARPGGRWNFWGLATWGRIRGMNIADNHREEVFAGGGKSFYLGDVTVRPGYALSWMSYDLNLGGFPSTDRGGDGVSAPGVGGYFSPSRFLNQMARLDVTIPVGTSLLTFGGVGVGRQYVEDTRLNDFSYGSTSSDAYLGARVNAGERVSIGGQVSYQNVASAFDRTVFRLTVAYGF